MGNKLWGFFKKYKYYILIPFLLILLLTVLMLMVSTESPMMPFRYAVR